MFLSWLLIETLEVELKDACFRQSPMDWMHGKLIVIHPLVSETALVSLLRPVDTFFCDYFGLHSSINYNQTFCNIPLDRIAEIESVSSVRVERAEVQGLCAHLVSHRGEI